MAVKNKWHVAPVIRQMENARVEAGLLPELASVGYTEQVGEEQAGTTPQPVNWPTGAYFYFGGSRQTPTP